MMQTENVLNDSRLRALENHTRVNLLRPTPGTTTVNGVTCTNNGDGTYTMNGTASASTKFCIETKIYSKGTYKFFGCPIGGSGSTYKIYAVNTTDSINYIGDFGSGYQFALSKDSILEIYLWVGSGVTCNNLVFKPMLTTDLSATYDDFVSYEDSFVTGSSQYSFGGIDTSRVLATFTTNFSDYIATEDCMMVFTILNYGVLIYINNIEFNVHGHDDRYSTVIVPIKKGQSVSTNGTNINVRFFGVKR